MYISVERMKSLFYNNSNRLQCPSFTRGKKSIHSRQTHKCKIAQDTAVLFDYVDIYNRYICSHSVEHASTVNSCIQQIIIPSINEQYEVVKTFTSITHQVRHMHDLEGVILKLLITHDVESLQSLLSSLEEYNTSIELIKNIVAYTNEIPMPSLATPFSN